MQRRCINCKQKWQSETHQPRNARFSSRAVVIARKKSFRGRLINSCRKMTDVFEEEKGEYMQMDLFTTNKANRHSRDKKSIIS